jgi:hypothetical protein
MRFNKLQKYEPSYDGGIYQTWDPQMMILVYDKKGIEPTDDAGAQSHVDVKIQHTVYFKDP